MLSRFQIRTVKLKIKKKKQKNVNAISSEKQIDQWMIHYHYRFDNNGFEVVTSFPKLFIRSLSLARNKINKIEPRAFRNLTALEKLDLSFNRLTYEALKPEVFEGFYDATTFEPLRSLKWISLAHNDIHSIDPDLFEHVPNLESLSLSNNPFKKFDTNTAIAIQSIPRLSNLDLGNMELKTLPDHIFHAPRQLKTLNLTGNLFNTLPEALGDALNLIYLNLDDNIFEAFGGNS